MNKLRFIIALFIIVSNSQLYAAQTLTTSRNLGFTQTLGNISSNSGNESINITTIEPHYSLQYEKTKLTLDAEYSLVASQDSQNNTSDVSHRLNLKSTYQHIPNIWSSSYFASILQKNTSDNGQLVNSNNTTSDATDNYIVNSFNTSRIYHINSNMTFNAAMDLSSQGFQDASKNKNSKITAQFDILRLLPSISFTSSVSNNRNLDSKETSNRINITGTYINNPQLNTFISATQFSGDNTSLEEIRYQLGLNWTLTPNSRIKLAIGKFGDQNSWSADSFIMLRRLSFSLTHTEEIEPANTTLLNNLNSGNNAFSNATSDALKFTKNTLLMISHQSRRLTSSFSISKNEQFSDLNINSDRTSYSSSISFNYSLNRLSTASYVFTNDKINSNIDNQLKQHTVKWSSKISRKSSYNVSIDFIEQISDQSLLDYQKKQLNFNYSLIF